MIESEYPTERLRWLDVGGMKPILQQLWAIETLSDGEAVSRREEWRNIPTEKAKK